MDRQCRPPCTSLIERCVSAPRVLSVSKRFSRSVCSPVCSRHSRRISSPSPNEEPPTCFLSTRSGGDSTRTSSSHFRLEAHISGHWSYHFLIWRPASVWLLIWMIWWSSEANQNFNFMADLGQLKSPFYCCIAYWIVVMLDFTWIAGSYYCIAGLVGFHCITGF